MNLVSASNNKGWLSTALCFMDQEESRSPGHGVYIHPKKDQKIHKC
jgi:hypothetical protein